MEANPCPVCRAPGGFHDETPHIAAVNRMPAHLLQRSNTSRRIEEREQRQAAYAAWLQQQEQGVAS